LLYKSNSSLFLLHQFFFFIGTISEVLEIGDICIGTYSQAVITLENSLTIDVKYILSLLDVSLAYSKDNTFVENKPNELNVATILCSNNMHIIPALSESTFTV